MILFVLIVKMLLIYSVKAVEICVIFSINAHTNLFSSTSLNVLILDLSIEFDKTAEKSLTPELERLLEHIAKTGCTVYVTVV